tara:strand:+ start:1108 stop:1311 length:204 start_codon:yes stop_codon:yes gene_type:complete
MTRKADLSDPMNDGEYNTMMMCPNQCGAMYSADKNDYFTVDNDYIFTCDECEEPLILVRKVITYEEI